VLIALTGFVDPDEVEVVVVGGETAGELDAGGRK
jgi:hypothetical protein